MASWMPMKCHAMHEEHLRRSAFSERISEPSGQQDRNRTRASQSTRRHSSVIVTPNRCRAAPGVSLALPPDDGLELPIADYRLPPLGAPANPKDPHTPGSGPTSVA